MRNILNKKWMLSKFMLGCWGSICLLLITFTSCATNKAGIAMPNIPMNKQCIVTGLNFGGSIGSVTTFLYDDIDFLVDDGAGAEYRIVPAGNKRVRIIRKYSWNEDYRITGSTQTWTRRTYWERWEGVFDFEPGKYYSIKLTALGSHGRNINIEGSGARYDQRAYTIIHPTNGNIEIIEDPRKTMGSIYIRPYAGTTLGQKYYGGYIPALEILNLGPAFGIQIINGYLNMDFRVEGHVGAGLTYPVKKSEFSNVLGEGDRGTGFSVTYDYGAYVNFSLWRFVLGGGIGMANGKAWYKVGGTHYDYGYAVAYEESVSQSYSSIPYAEFVMGFTGPVFRRSTPALNLYGRYYFLGDGDNNSRMGIGLKVRL